MSYQQPSVVSEPGESAFDLPAPTVSPQLATIVKSSASPVLSVRAGQLDSSTLQALAQRVAVVCLVVDHALRILAGSAAPFSGNGDPVERLLQEMRAGTREKARFWIDTRVGSEERKHKILIEYYALRSPRGRYLGCLEVTQDIEDIQALEGEKRLME